MSRPLIQEFIAAFNNLLKVDPSEYRNAFRKDANNSSVSKTLTNFLAIVMKSHVGTARDITSAVQRIRDKISQERKSNQVNIASDFSLILKNLITIGYQPLEFMAERGLTQLERERINTELGGKLIGTHPFLREILKAHVPLFFRIVFEIDRLPSDATKVMRDLKTNSVFIDRYEALIADEYNKDFGSVTIFTAIHIIYILESRGKLTAEQALAVKLDLINSSLRIESYASSSEPVGRYMIKSILFSENTNASVTNILNFDNLAFEDILNDIFSDMAENLASLIASEASLTSYTQLYALASWLEIDPSTLMIHLLKRLPDEISLYVLRALKQQSDQFSAKLLEEYHNLNKRLILSFDELSDTLEDLEFKHYYQDDAFRKALDSVVDGEDLVKFAFGDKFVFTKCYRVNGDVEIDVASQTITLHLVFTARDKSHTKELTLVSSWDVDTGFLKINLLEGEIDLNTDSNIREIIRFLLINESGIFKQQSTKSVSSNGVITPVSLAPMANREERIQQYTPATKSFRARAPKYSPSRLEISAESSNKVHQQKDPNKRHIIGLDEESIQKMLDDAGIADHGIVTAREIFEFLTRQLNSPLSLGKQLESAPSALRQLSIKGGKNPVRIYLQRIDGRTFKLIGILYKKSSSQQQKFILALINKMQQTEN